MAISETIGVDAGPAIGELRAFTAAVKESAAEWKASMGELKFPDFGGGGAAKAGEGADAAAAKLKMLGDAGKAASGGLDAAAGSAAAAGAELKGLGGAGAAAASGLGKAADAGKALADSADAVAKSSTTANDSVKGLGDTTKTSSAWLDEYQATMAETARTQADFAKVSADANARIAAGQRLNTAAARQASADAVASHKAQARAAEQSAAAAEASSHRWKMAGLAGLAVVAYGVDQAAKLQAGVTRLYTTAGESQKNLPMISAGILKLAPETATSQADLLKGAYMAESAGFHGKSALNVLKAGAEGAYAEGAPLGDTINALTSMLNAYGLKGPRAPVSAMDQIIAMVSRGKMTMAGAVSALPTVLPTAAAAGLNFGQVGGALATMTAMGASPDLAAQHLNHTIGSLQNMSGVQVKEISQLGGDPVKLEKNLGKTGLLGTLTDINKLVMGSMGKSGLVMMKTFNQSASAAGDANRMLGAMPSAIKGVAQAYADGKISAKAWNKEVFSGSESAQQKNLLQQFATVENQAKGFNNLLKSGSPAAQTYMATLSKALGGQTGLQTFLQLMGIHLPAAQSNTQAVTQAGKHPAADVAGWPEVQKTLKFQLGSADQALQSVATELGKGFLPLATTGLKDLGNVAKFFAGHQTLTKDLGILAGGGLGLKLGAQIASSIKGNLGSLGKALKIPGLSNLGKGGGLDGAATSLDTAGASLKGAAGSLSAAAEKLGGVPGMPGGKPGEPGEPIVTPTGTAGTAAGGATAAEEGAAGLGAGALIKGIGVGGLLRGGIGFAIADIAERMVADSLPKPTKAQANALKPDEKGLGWWIDTHMLGKQGAENAGNLINRLQHAVPVRHQIATLFDDTRHGVSSLFSSSGTAAPQTPQENIRFGAGTVAPPPPPPPARYPSGRPFYGEVPQAGPAGPMLGVGGHPFTIKPKISPPDTGAIKGALANLANSVHLKPVKIPPPDTSALNAAKGKAQAAGQGITAAIEQAMHKPVKLPPPDLSAASAAAGKAAGIGANISGGLAAGIEAGKGAVEAAAADVANAAAAAMAHAAQTHSPSKKTEKTGKDVAAGLVVGLEGGKSAVDAAATAIGKNAAKAAAIAAIDAASKELLGQVPKGDTALTAMLKADTKDLGRMANTRAKLEQEISNSEQVAKSAISGASIMNALTAVNPAGNEPLAVSSIVTGQGYQAADLKQFAQALQKDKALGLNATELSQIAQAGPGQGLGIAQGIASGGKDAVRQLNAIQKEIQSSSAQIGDIGGVAMYQAGKDMGAGLAAGLKKALASDEKAIEHLAKSMTDSVSKHAKEAKDKAKQAVTGSSGGAGDSKAAPAGVGTKDSLAAAAASLSGAGTALSAAATALSAAAASLKKAGSGDGSSRPGQHPVPHPVAGGGGVLPRFPSPSGFGGYGGVHGGGGAVVIHHNPVIHVEGNVTTEQNLATSLASIYQERGLSNWQSLLRVPGRAN